MDSCDLTKANACDGAKDFSRDHTKPNGAT